MTPSPQEQRPRVRVLVTHQKPHLDEVFACWLMLRYGQRRFSWPENDPPRILYAGSDEEARRLVEELGEECVPIGMLGGTFDEHRADGRIPNVTSADLVGEYLGLIDLTPTRRVRCRELRILFDENLRADTQPGQRHLELGQVLKTLANYGTLSQEDTQRYVFAICDGKRAEGEEFNDKCPSAFAKNGHIKRPGGTFTVALVASDLRKMSPWCRSYLKADIVVQFRSDGHVQIFSGNSPRARRGITEIAFALMHAEFKRAKRDPSEWDALDRAFNEIMRSERGRELPGAEHWYFHVEAATLLNGSTTHPDVPTTGLSPEEIERIVCIALSDLAKRR